jgi:hypothetical protein
MSEIYIKHKDWEGVSIIENNKLYRKNLNDENGTYTKKYNKITIKWDKWNEEDFYFYDNNLNYYLKDIFNDKFINMYIFEKNILQLILNRYADDFVLLEDDYLSKKSGNYIIDNDLIILEFNDEKKKYIYKRINNNIYCAIDDYYKNVFFELKITNNNINEDYIFNKRIKKFFNSLNIDVNGTYNINDNCLNMKWNDGYCKNFYSNKYISFDKINKNIIIIKPNNIFLDDRILFSNITLCKTKIILSSMYFKLNPIDFESIIFNIDGINISNKIIYDYYNEYEPVCVIILELNTFVDNLLLKINYKTNSYNIYLEQLNITEHNISAMTMFKDDYQLLKRYLKYYNHLGVDTFFLYYNKNIEYNIIEEIIKLNEYNIQIYLVEWNYIYWWKDIDNSKYHHAQIMAINDSFNILKNYGNYTLFNDLDEYIVLDEIDNFKKLIDLNNNVDMFVFKNRFCKMGNELIKYKDFDVKFDLTQIINGNYYDQGREKNLVKLKNINMMGIHKYVKKYNENEDIKEKVISHFCHIINYEEKYRENLMTEYVF